MRPWARWLTIGYACYYIVSTIIGVVFAFLVTVPIMKELFEDMRADPNIPPAAWRILNMTETIATLTPYFQLFLLVYPLALLLVLFMPDVRAAFRGEPADHAEDEDFDDEDEALDVEGIQPGDGAVKPQDKAIQPDDKPTEG
jgi:hypothetical protein